MASPRHLSRRERTRLYGRDRRHLEQREPARPTRLLLRQFGEPLRRQIEALREAGIEPDKRLFVLTPTPPDTDRQVGDFYATSTWPEHGPTRP
jgi:hypothetical protein